jgi:hypothetical protein
MMKLRRRTRETDVQFMGLVARESRIVIGHGAVGDNNKVEYKEVDIKLLTGFIRLRIRSFLAVVMAVIRFRL